MSYLAYVETHPAVVRMACLAGLAEALGTTVDALLGADSTEPDGATATPALPDLWIPDVITGRRGERPGPFLG